MSKPRKTQIIEACQEILVSEGPRALTMRRIADAVGISAPALYRHFRDRDAILLALMASAGERFRSYLQRPAEADDPLGQLIEVGMNYLAFALDHEPEFGLLFGGWPELQHPEALSGAPPSEGLQLLLGKISACLSTPLAFPELMTLAMEQWALVHGLATLYLYGGGRYQMTRPQLEAMSRGILARAAERLE